MEECDAWNEITVMLPKNRELENKYFGRWGFDCLFIFFENLGSFAFY